MPKADAPRFARARWHGPDLSERAGWKNPNSIKRLLSAETGQQGLDDSRDEEDKYKVSSDAAGRIVFFDFGHGSSQGFAIGGGFPPTDPRAGLYIVGRSGQKLEPDSQPVRGFEAESGRGECIQTDGSHDAPGLLSGPILSRFARKF